MYCIKDFGAIADGKTLATRAIQAAIDSCAENGGGTVDVPAGRYLTGSVFLKDHVELHLSHGATLVASTDLADYNTDDAYEQNYGSTTEEWRAKHLIMAIECTDVAICGGGTIDASGDFFYEEPQFYPHYEWMTGYVWRQGMSYARNKELLRPGQVVCFVECTNVRVQDITIRNSPCWSLFLYGCEQVSVRGIKVYNQPHFGNTDGIDIDCCRFVTVSDCIIDTGDDAITLRTAAHRLKKPRPCEYITISNCVLSCSVMAIRIGVGTGQIRHICISNIVIPRAGAALQCITSYAGRGCAEIEDVRISGVSGSDLGHIMHLKGEIGSIRHITLENMRLSGIGNLRVEATNTCVIEDITLRNIDIRIHTEKEAPDARRRAARGEYMLSLRGVHTMRLEQVRVKSSPSALFAWSGGFAKDNCTDVTVADCVFPDGFQ